MTDKRRRLPSQRTLLLVAAVLLLAGLVWVLGPGARWVVDLDVDVTKLPAKDLAAAADAVRGRALAIATGLVALAAVYYTARNAETARRAVELTQQTSTRTLELTEQGQVTDRYTKAIQQLGDSDNLHIRIGGIYALERIARDSARDHGTVQEVLTAFVREYEPELGQPAAQVAEDGTTQVAHIGKVPADVQAALAVIGRADMLGVDLTGANLAGANLVGADLSGADLSGADLSGADLTNADLIDATLSGADLSGARLSGADLRGAVLTGAELADATLSGATLTNVDLTRAILTRAILTRADLTDATLSGANLTDAYVTRADLTDAGLSGASLIGATLTSANLTRADLTDADLTRASLIDATLTGANLTRAQYDSAAAKRYAIPPARFLDDPPEEQAQPS
ncbi:pentapeptide repeat-containing protein [Nonomuraea sp. B19D2]|uniref:pentapeptide repeat-containing protein n=1 Tax=Nonomuraea sp. B19D2 TaxID=3159561 RepID=UPI0032DA5199